MVFRIRCNGVLQYLDTAIAVTIFFSYFFGHLQKILKKRQTTHERTTIKRHILQEEARTGQRNVDKRRKWNRKLALLVGGTGMEEMSISSTPL